MINNSCKKLVDNTQDGKDHTFNCCWCSSSVHSAQLYLLPSPNTAVELYRQDWGDTPLHHAPAVPSQEHSIFPTIDTVGTESSSLPID